MTHDDALPALPITFAEMLDAYNGGHMLAYTDDMTLVQARIAQHHAGLRAVEQRVRAALAARGEPVAKVRVHRAGGNAGIAWSAVAVTDGESLPLMPDGALLYAARPALPPGAREAMRMAADALTKIDESRIWPDSVNRNHAAIDALRPWLREGEET